MLLPQLLNNLSLKQVGHFIYASYKLCLSTFESPYQKQEHAEASLLLPLLLFLQVCTLYACALLFFKAAICDH